MRTIITIVGIVLITSFAPEKLSAQDHIVGGVIISEPRPCKLSAEYDKWVQYRFGDFTFCTPSDVSVQPKWGAEVLFMGYKTKKVTFTAGLLYSKPWRTSDNGKTNIRKSTSEENGMSVIRFSYEVTKSNQFPYSDWQTAHFEPIRPSKTSFHIAFGSVESLGDIPEQVFRSVSYVPKKISRKNTVTKKPE